MKTNLLTLLTGLLVALGSSFQARAAESATFTVGEKTFTRPAAWQPQPVAALSLRKADFLAPSADGKTNAEIVFFQFGAGAGGTVQQNIDRWMSQFAEPRDKIHATIENVTIGKTPVTYVSAEGTYNSGMPGAPTTPTPDTRLLGAILGKAGDNLIFVRMTGPKSLVGSTTADFKKMIESGLK